MALTLTEQSPVPPSKVAVGGADAGLIWKVYKVDFDASYPTGGESLAAADVALTTVLFVSGGLAEGYFLEYDYTNSKLKAFYGDFNAVADGALIEVPNTTDLSALNARVLIVGR